jgi:hypothetical protein
MPAKLKNIMTVGLLTAVLTGCAGDKAAYPSLALRPFETAPVAPAKAPAPDAAKRPVINAPQLSGLRDKAAASHAAFLQGEPRAQALARAAAGQPFESNARAAAIVALADLDAQHGATAAALAEIDALAAEAAVALAADPALAAAQAEIAALLARQDASIARLWEQMGT